MKTYIKNYGSTKTYMRNNKKKSVNEINWMGDYNGNEANISVMVNDNGRKEQIKMKLDNNDIIQLLNIPSIERPLDERLTADFMYPQMVMSYKKTKTRKYNKKNKSNSSKSNSSKSKKNLGSYSLKRKTNK